MPSYDPELTSGDPYYDDYDGTKNHLKILFKPGYAVQARELTQLQTALQTQIERFGDFVFKNGTPVIGANLSTDEVSFVRTDSLSSSDITNLVNDFVSGTGEKAGLRAKVVGVESGLTSGNDTYSVVFLKYLSGGGTGESVFSASDQVYSETQSINFTIKGGSADLISPAGSALACSIDTGIFYMDGFFVHVVKQTHIPYRLSESNEYEKSSALEDGIISGASAGIRLYQFPTNRVGLKVNKKIVDFLDDATLTDPSRGSYNYAAPGADRYSVDPVLESREFDITSQTPSAFVSDDFVDLLRLENGTVTSRYDRTQLSGLEDILARRTYDESGNYTVDPFITTMLNHLRVDKYQVDVNLTSPTEVFSIGDTILGSGTTAEILEVLDRTNFVGATSQRLIVDMEAGKFVVGNTIQEQVVSGDYAEGSVNAVTFLPDASGVYSQEQGGTASKLVASLDPGKAYVYGYEFDTISSTNIETDRARTTDSVTGYNLPANIGNYMVGETDALALTDGAIQYSSNRFDAFPFYIASGVTLYGASGPFDMNQLPKVELKSNYVQINIPYQPNLAGKANVLYWAPLFASEHNTAYDSELVLTDFSSATMESSSNALISGESSGSFYLPTSISQGGAYTSTVAFAPYTKLDKYLQKIVFNQGYRSGVNYNVNNGLNITNLGDYSAFRTAYGSAGSTCGVLRQIIIGDLNSETPSAYVRAGGVARKWVPAESLTYRSGSALLLQSTGTSGFHSAGNVIQQGWAGISGTTQNCTPISYGSTIQTVINKSIKPMDVADPIVSGVNGYNSSKNYAIGDIVRQVHFGVTTDASLGGFTTGFSGSTAYYTNPTDVREAIGEVIAWVLTTNGPVLYVENVSGVTFKKSCGHHNQSYPDMVYFTGTCDSCFPCSDGFVGLIDLVSTEVPTGGGNTLDYQYGYGYEYSDYTGDIEVQEIRFRSDDRGAAGNGYLEMLQNDNDGSSDIEFNPGDAAVGDGAGGLVTAQSLIDGGYVGSSYKHSQPVYQFTYNDWDTYEQSYSEWNGNANIVNKGIVISWDSSQKKLFVERCDGFQGFQKDLGYVFGIYNAACGEKFVAYGADGIQSHSSVSEKEAAIVDIDGPYNITTPNFVGYGSYSEGETASQLLQSKTNFVPGRYYSVGEKVAQQVPGSGPTGFATGTVEFFSARNAGNSGDTQDTVILIKKDSGSRSFEVGSDAKPIIEGTVSGNNFTSSASGRVNTASKAYGLSPAYFSGKLGTVASPYDSYTSVEVPVTIGTARISQIREQSNDQHQISFFDVVMYSKRPGSPFFLSETQSVYYGFAKQNTIASTTFPGNPRQTIGGKLFDIHPTYLNRVYNPELNTLLFPIPIGNIVKTVNAMDYRVKKSYDVVFTNPEETNVTISTGSQYIRFVGGNQLGGLVDGTDLNNYIMVNTEGKIMDLFSDAFTLTTNNVVGNEEGTLTITKNIGGTGSYPNDTRFTLIALLDVNPADTIQQSPISFKKLKEVTTEFEVSSLAVNDRGQYYFPLENSDIYSFISAYDNGVSATADVKNLFTLDNGQKDFYYDRGKLFLTRNGRSATGSTTDIQNGLANIVGPIEVTYRYFDHTGNGPFVSDSYINNSPDPGEIPFTFDEIPTYNRAGRGDQIRLNDVVDFRPTFNGTTFSRVFLPSSGSAFNISYSYYLPRIDKLVLTRNKEFKIIKGVPGLNPTLPESIVDAMELYRFYIPAYTYDSKDVQTRFIDNKRFTMRDIGKLERRINQLEYYSTLSLLELSTETLFIADADGNNRFKNGIIVDQFTGHGVGNVTNPDYNCSIDFRNLELRPPFIPRLVEFDVKTTNSLIQTSDDLIILPYTTENLVTQPLATTSININPFSVVNWLGGVVLDPSSDFWIDTTRAADVLVNLEGDNDAWEELGAVAFETEWGEWETRVVGTRREGFDNVTTFENSREGVELRIVPERIERNIGDRVIDVSIIPFMRSITLNVTATGLRPNTRVYAFFDGVNVSDDCTFLDGGTRKTLTEAPLISDSSGAIVSDKAVQFVVPAGQFRTGERLFRLTDEADDIVANAKTSAEVMFPAQGLLQTRQDVSISTRVPTLVRNSVTESVITEERQARDPLAQTFFLNAAEYPNGVQVDSVTVFFKKKSSTLPVTLQLRTVVNGYPSGLVYPFANVTKRPEEVNISETPDVADTGTGTTFKFSSPVHLLPGQHSIVLLSNSDDYEAYISVMGETQIGTDTPVVEQPNLGSLFKSQNASTWTADQNADLMFKIHKCKFDTSGVNQFSLVERKGSNGVSEEIKVDTFNVAAGLVNWPNSVYRLSLRTTPNIASAVSATDAETTIVANETFSFTTSRKVNLETDNTNETLILNGTIVGTDPDLSPVFDLQRVGMIAIENRFEGNIETSPTSPSYNGELDPQSPPVEPGGTKRARYITKAVSLAQGFEARNISVFLTQYKPEGTEIQVFVKQQPQGTDAPFDNEPYVQLTPDSTINSEQLREVQYKLTEDLVEPMSKFAIKIVLYTKTGNTSIVPYIKDMRGIALA